MKLLLGIDLGTSYFKVGLFDSTGLLQGLGRVAVVSTTGAHGRCELAADDFWRLLRQGLAQALAQAGAHAGQIVGLSYSTQANTFILLDERAKPLTPVVIWTDRRASPVEPAVARFGASTEFHRATGFVGLSAEFAPVKWRWFQRVEPALWERAARVMTLSDYFTFALTGEAAVDASSAAFTGIYATATGGWWPVAQHFFHVRDSQLSRVLPPGCPCGRTVPQATRLLGLPPGVPFAVGALDHHAAAIGSGLERFAEASISTGTVLAALTLADAVEPVAGCYHGPHLDGRFYRLAFDPAGANQLEAYQKESAPHLGIAELVDLASKVPPGAGVAAPRGEKADQRHGREVRIIMERISATQRTLLQRLCVGQRVRRVIATGGGAQSDTWLQIKADMLDATIIAPRCHERACLGAAAFAAVAAQLYRNVSEALLAMVHSDRVVEPRPTVVAAYRTHLAGAGKQGQLDR